MANKYGNKLAPGDPDLPRQLRTTQSQNLAGSPKGRRVGPFGDSAPKAPVAATKRGRKGKAIRS